MVAKEKQILVRTLGNPFLMPLMTGPIILGLHSRALEILKSELVQPMTMTSSMSPFPKKKNMCISPVTKTNDNWQSYNSF